MSAKKPKQVRVYLNEEAADLTKAASEEIGDISESQIVSILVLAGLRALREFRSAAGTAMEAGHSEAILFRHYREIVTPSSAAEFWAIRPDPEEARPPTVPGS